MLRHSVFAAATAALLLTPVLAQDGPPPVAGVAVAQAPEAGLGLCFGLDLAGTAECAQNECMEQSGLGAEDCAVNLWCYPHGWVAQVAVLHTEGIHWTKVICDEFDRETLDRAVALYCDSEYYAECFAVRIWDREGSVVLDYQ